MRQDDVLAAIHAQPVVDQRDLFAAPVDRDVRRYTQLRVQQDRHVGRKANPRRPFLGLLQRGAQRSRARVLVGRDLDNPASQPAGGAGAVALALGKQRRDGRAVFIGACARFIRGRCAAMQYGQGQQPTQRLHC
ncbi:hypothetical protein G6F68_017080 [Rhizopus microsporus]|nr:hypothetical protein G6F68_017080 [Rhizopus microsporus]